MSSETSTLGEKRSKREENSIIIHFILYFVLSIWLIIFITTSLIPKVIKIENEKKLTKEIYNNIKTVEKEWLTFNEFIILSDWWKKDKVVYEILKNMTENFYNENLVNKTDKLFNDFLNLKKEELNSVENITIVNNQIKQISTILPSYSDVVIDLWWDTLTDYKFINYVESLLETFGLSTSSSIGIKKIWLFKEYVWSTISWWSLESNLYYIPLNLILSWDKAWIINFIYYLENVWNITINGKEIILKEDNGFLSKNWRKIILEGEYNSVDYNIFAHQMIDIEKISMKNYIDSSYIDRGNIALKDFIIKNQWNQNFEININLLFYVKGEPAYKIEEFINNILNKQKETISFINARLKNTKTIESIRRKLMKQKTTLTQMNSDIINIKKGLVQKEKLNELYKKALELDSVIDPIFKGLN